MQFIDTHTHLFLPEFKNDRTEVLNRVRENNISKLFLPNVDTETISDLKDLSNKYPDLCYPLMGLHPGSVKDDYEKQLYLIEKELRGNKYYGIGEIGIDLYWDKKYKKEQIKVFEIQIEWAKEMKLPIVIHLRNAFDEVIGIVNKHNSEKLTGIFHCFTGSEKQAKEIIETGFFLGIGGIVTFKNSGLDKTLENVPIEKIVLETDSPYLAPTPYRGKRNESSYLIKIAEKLAEIYKISLEEVAKITSRNAEEVFLLD